MSTRIGPIGPADAGELLTVQRAAYVAEAQLNGVLDLPPLRETTDEIAADLASSTVLSFGAWLGTRLVGSVRGRLDGDRMEISRLAVAPDQQGRGLGRALLAHVTAATPPAVRTLWLVTGVRSAGNLRMYARAGFEPVDEREDALGVPVVVLEKSAGVQPDVG